jgi:hypothetical protein
MAIARPVAVAIPQQPAFNDDGECQDGRRQKGYHDQAAFEQEGKEVLMHTYIAFLTLQVFLVFRGT